MEIKKGAKKSCYFCEKGKEPSYKDYEELARFISERGKIMGRRQTVYALSISGFWQGR